MNTNEKAENAIRICMACDDKYAIHCASAIASMIDNHKSEEKLEFFILNRNISEKNKKRLQKLANTGKSSINFISVNPEVFKNCPVPVGMHFSLETYFRLKIPEIFPDFDKILYIDCDVTVLGEIKELWDFDVANFYAAACPDITQVKHLSEFIGENPYFNAGIMVINLKKWRGEKISEKCFEFIKNHPDKIIWVDQDVLNSVLCGKMAYLPRIWNLEYCPANDVVSNLYQDCEIKLIHHITRQKPWNVPENRHKYARFYYKYLYKTPWKHHVFLIKFELRIRAIMKFFSVYLQNFKCKREIEKLAKNRKIVLWGASLFVCKLIQKFGLKSENILGIIDKNPDKSGQTVGKFRIFAPDDLKELKPDLIVSAVLFRPNMKTGIQQELDRLGLKIEICDDLFGNIKEY